MFIKLGAITFGGLRTDRRCYVAGPGGGVQAVFHRFSSSVAARIAHACLLRHDERDWTVCSAWPQLDTQRQAPFSNATAAKVSEAMRGRC
jgi:hypothetical protein